MYLLYRAVSFRERDEQGQWGTKQVLEAREMGWNATRGRSMSEREIELDRGKRYCPAPVVCKFSIPTYSAPTIDPRPAIFS
jgi:hypothetical protein